ncbi:MAG: hypothetical protein WDO13_17610 [Verrucomicrobiota bacterium]
MYAATSGALFFLLSTGYDVCWIGWVWLGITGILVVEPLLQAVARFYQPVTLRKSPAPIGSSLSSSLSGAREQARGCWFAISRT